MISSYLIKFFIIKPRANAIFLVLSKFRLMQTCLCFKCACMHIWFSIFLGGIPVLYSKAIWILLPVIWCFLCYTFLICMHIFMQSTCMHTYACSWTLIIRSGEKYDQALKVLWWFDLIWPRYLCILPWNTNRQNQKHTEATQV